MFMLDVRNFILNKAECFDICHRLRNKVPICPYFHLPCRNFYINLGSGVCCENNVRCSWLPSWVADSSVNFYAVLWSDGCLHV